MNVAAAMPYDIKAIEKYISKHEIKNIRNRITLITTRACEAWTMTKQTSLEPQKREFLEEYAVKWGIATYINTVLEAMQNRKIYRTAKHLKTN